MIRAQIRPQIRSQIRRMIGGIGGGFVDPVPGFLSNHRFDGNDSSLIPIMSPPLLVGLDLPDLTGSNLNGVDQFFDASADLALLNSIGTSDFSFGGWIKTDALNFESIFSTSDEGIDGSGFKISKAGTGKIQFRISGAILVTDANVVTGDWVHVFATLVHGGNTKWYVNGALDSTHTTPAYDINSQTVMYYGATSSGNAQFDGSLDGWRLYPFATDAAQVLSLYNNTEA